jgi:tetratricopeptide (TPR) repeat protein
MRGPFGFKALAATRRNHGGRPLKRNTCRTELCTLRRRARARQALLIAVIVAAGYFGRELRLVVFEQRQGSLRHEDIYYLPPAQWLPVMSGGFQAALADLIWCKSLVYFGEELLQQGTIRYVFEYTDAVLALDPDFRSAYTWIATAALYQPQETSLDDGLRAAEYLERAIKRWPNDGELHWRYGALLRFELAPSLPSGPRKDALAARAAPHLAIAASLGAGPPWLALNSSSLLQRIGKTEQAIRHLEEVYGTVQDNLTKQRIEEQLAALRSRAFVEALKTANAEFEQRRAASYPYLSPNLFLLVGDKLAERWPALVAARFLSPPPTDEADE